MNNERLRRTVGQRIAEARTKTGMSQADLGRVIGVSGPRISHFESGHSIPKASYRTQLAEALKVEPDVLFGADVEMPRRRMRPIVRRTMGARKATTSREAALVNKQILRLIEGMSYEKRQLALSILRSIDRSTVVK